MGAVVAVYAILLFGKIAKKKYNGKNTRIDSVEK